MATKKRRGLHGSPEEHASKAESAAKSALRYFKSSLAAPSCGAAFSQLIEGAEYLAEADAHAGEALRVKAYYTWGETLAVASSQKLAAKNAFKNSCLASSSLHGLRRRRRSR